MRLLENLSTTSCNTTGMVNMKLNIITFLIAVIGVLAYIEHLEHNHEEAPTHSPELLEFIDECERDNLIVTWISEETVSCTRK